MIPANVFCCRGRSTAAEQAAIISEARELGFVVSRKIDNGQAVLELKKGEHIFIVANLKDWQKIKVS